MATVYEKSKTLRKIRRVILFEDTSQYTGALAARKVFTEPVVVSASAIGASFLEDNRLKGRTITIPSLNITIKSKVATEDTEDNE